MHTHDDVGDGSDGSHDGRCANCLANESGAIGLASDGGMDWSGLNATQQEIGQVLDALAEVDAEDADLDAWAAGLSDDEIAQLEHEAALDNYGSGPDLANEAAAYGDQAGDYADMVRSIDLALQDQARQAGARRTQDQAERNRRSGHRSGRPSAEDRMASALGRLEARTYLPGQADLSWGAGDPDISDLFATGPLAGPADVRTAMLYQLNGGARPRARGRQPMPPVQGLAARIGLR